MNQPHCPDGQPHAQPTHPATPAQSRSTMQELWHLSATLLAQSSREALQRDPLAALTISPPFRLSAAKYGAPRAESMRRLFLNAAISLLWPIGRVRALFWLWRQGSSHALALAHTRRVVAALSNRCTAQAPTGSRDMSSAPAARPAATTGNPASASACLEDKCLLGSREAVFAALALGGLYLTGSLPDSWMGTAFSFLFCSLYTVSFCELMNRIKR